MLKQLAAIFLLTVGLVSYVRSLDHIGSANQSDVYVCQTQRDDLNLTIDSVTISVLNQLMKQVRGDNRSIPELTLSCPNKLTINLAQASISNKNRTLCPGDKAQRPDDCEETLLSTIFAKRQCQGLAKCSLSINRDFNAICIFASQKYVYVSYSCIEPVALLKKKPRRRSKRYIRLNYHLRPKGRYYKAEGYGEGYGGGKVSLCIICCWFTISCL